MSARAIDSAAARAAFEQAVRDHDAAVAHSGAVIWVGAEPTFTDRLSEASEWLSVALGRDKETRARRMLRALSAVAPGALVLRTVGRQYPREPRARWSLGLYQRRDGTPFWTGPPDPMQGLVTAGLPDLDVFAVQLEQALRIQGWMARSLRADLPFGLRVMFACDPSVPLPDPTAEPHLLRPSVHALKLPSEGLVDELAGVGVYLLSLGMHADIDGEPPCACLELPALPDVPTFLRCLQVIGQAAAASGLQSLILQGYPPPVDATVAWTTVTPDPAVIEVNQAPAPDVQTLLAWDRELFGVAESTGLKPYRLYYNGTVADSGGGGQITLGGPTPAHSPFFVAPHLLSRLVRYLNAHPSLSYLFAPDSIGSHSQAPRPDEGVRESLAELAVALEQLQRNPAPTPEAIWRGLSPFLADPSGNPHRSEINIEKLWNPYLPGRGHLGLVEFRALRMAMSSDHAAALAALLRAVVAMLANADVVPTLVEWGAALHERFAMPYYLRRDLLEILADLRAHGLGLGEPLVDQLFVHSRRLMGVLEREGCRLELEQALEFWPLIGDVASQESGGARLVDASTARLQVALRPLSGHPVDIDGWQVLVDGYRLPLRSEHDAAGPVRLYGLRYRRFSPLQGLHPSIPAHGPITLTLRHRSLARATSVTLHEWHPQGMAYPGLPVDLQDAAARRAERFVVVTREAPTPEQRLEPPPTALSGYCLDLRRL